jgi:translation initiation factor 2B subunit (eIF-2B alpha/beta/delta family)
LKVKRFSKSRVVNIYPPMKKYNLKNILKDRTSGSTELVLKINRYFKVYIDNVSLIKQSINEIESEMTSFEAVLKYLNSIRKIMSSGNKKKLEKFVNDFEFENLSTHLKIYNNLKPWLRKKKRAFTLSNSQTVFEIIKLWFKENEKIEMVIAESRPAFEGRVFAKKLIKLGVKVYFISDCNSAEYISKCDLVLIGADKILSNGDVVNKTGSRNAAIIAKYYSKSFIVISAESKFSKQKVFKPKIKDSKQIWKFKNKNLKIENNCSEVVPKKLITKVITEKDTH